MGERDDLDRIGQFQRIQVDAAVVGDAVPAQRGAGAASELLPGHEVRVMLQLGDDDVVPGPYTMFETVVAEHVGDQVQRLGGVLREHQLVAVRADELGDRGTSTLVRIGGFLGELMRAAVHCRVAGGEELALGVEHLDRPL